MKKIIVAIAYLSSILNGAAVAIFDHMAKEARRVFRLLPGKNGRTYVPLSDVDPAGNFGTGNTKTGKGCGTCDMPIEQTCDHSFECYKLGLCYACNGAYNFAANKAAVTENLKAFLTDPVMFRDSIGVHILVNGLKFFRWHTVGDIVNRAYLQVMIDLARMFPEVKFWAYTKKYAIVNHYCDDNGGADAIPANLAIIFSHWMNKDGSYHPMDNPYDFPTSEFIPYGREDLVKTVTHVCPCSDPEVLATCLTCDHPCYDLKHGESMALLEHSTPETKKRDKEIKAKKSALKKAA